MAEKHLLTPEKSAKSQQKKPKTVSSESQHVHGDPTHKVRDDSLEMNAAESVPPVWFTKFFSGFEVRLEQRLDVIVAKRLEVLSSTVKEHGEKITACEIDVEVLKSQVKKLKEDNVSLSLKIDDIENRSRRMNLVFHGIPEVAVSGQREVCTDVIKDVLQTFVGLSAADYSMERCHRTPTAPFPTVPPSPSQKQNGDVRPKPRMIHVYFGSFLQREKVRAACMKKFKEKEYKGRKLFVAEDFSKRIQQLRKNKMEDFKRLKSEGRKPFFLYPAKLAYRVQNTGKLQIVS